MGSCWLRGGELQLLVRQESLRIQLMTNGEGWYQPASDRGRRCEHCWQALWLRTELVPAYDICSRIHLVTSGRDAWILRITITGSVILCETAHSIPMWQGTSLRTFCEWIGTNNCIENIKKHLKGLRRDPYLFFSSNKKKPIEPEQTGHLCWANFSFKSLLIPHQRRYDWYLLVLSLSYWVIKSSAFERKQTYYAPVKANV